MVFLYVLLVYFISSTCAKNCDHIDCANIFDEVCGQAEYRDGTYSTFDVYQNICFLRLKLCRQESIAGIYEVADHLCNIQKHKRSVTLGGRRLTNFGIVGAHQACNHSCPTHCPETYEPACAKIWKPGMTRFQLRTMINHCHIDQFSCAAALNVTILPLGKCVQKEARLLFMQQIAALKSLQLLDDNWAENANRRSYRRSKSHPHDRVDDFLTKDTRGLWKFHNPEDSILRDGFETAQRSMMSRKPFEVVDIVYKSNNTRSELDEDIIKSYLTNLVKRILRTH